MPDAHILAFTLAGALLVVTPGLDTALVLRTLAVAGRPAAMRAGLGICAGCLAWGLAATFGLAALLATSQTLYTGLRIAGAAYLLWFGMGLLLRPRRSLPTEGDEAERGRWFRRGLLTNVLNPKIGVFYVTLLPQFIPAGGDALAYGALYTAIHAAEGLLWFAVLSAAVQPIAAALRRPRVLATVDRLTGGLFVAFGARLAIDGTS